jgi:hypothetical protein
MSRPATSTLIAALVLALSGIYQNASAAEPAADLFRSLVTAENLDLGNTAEFPANPEMAAADAAKRQTFFLSLLGIRGTREESRGGWRTGKTEEKNRHLRLAFKAPLAVGTILGGDGAVSYLKPAAAFPGDVNDEAQWVNVPLPRGQAGMRVWTFPPGVVTRALRFSFTTSPPAKKTSHSGIQGTLILAERLHNLTPEADAYASSEKSHTGIRYKRENEFRVGNLVNELYERIPYNCKGEWTAAPKQEVSREHPQWVVLAWPEAKTFSGVGLLNAFAKELEIDAFKGDAAGHPAIAPEPAWSKVGAVTWPVRRRPSYTAVQIRFAEPVTTRALRVRIVKTLSDENPDIVGHFNRNPKDRNRHVSLGGVMAFATLGDTPIPPRPARGEKPPLAVRYTMPYAGKVALAINDANGRRVRNLIADVERSVGEQSEPWDGCDDAGNPVPPGAYSVKGIAHQPLHLAYRGTVNVSGDPPWMTSPYNQLGPGGWLSDHKPPYAVTAIGERVFVSALLAESGHGILACDLDGNKLWGEHRFGGGEGLAYAGFLAQDGGKVYTVGHGWGNYLTVTEIDPANFKARANFLRLDFSEAKNRGPSGSGSGLSGLAARNGKVYVTFSTLDRVSIADIATAKWERDVAVAEPSWPTFDPQGRLTLVSAKRVVCLELEGGTTEPVLPEGAVADPRGLAFDAQGNLHVADGSPEVVKVFAVGGKLMRVIGEPGGREVGTYNPNRIENPQGIAIDVRGNLWVAESDYQPKRTSVWSPEGKLLKEFIGPTEYGGGGRIDSRDPSRIYYAGMEFSLDHATGQCTLKRILSRSVRVPDGTIEKRMRDDAAGQSAFTLTEGNIAKLDRPVYLNRRQYMVSDPGKIGTSSLLLIGEFRKDRVVPLTAVGNADKWWSLTNDPALRKLTGDRRLEDLGFCWSDRDGDGMPQPGEVDLFDFRLDSTYWPSVVNPRLEVVMGRRLLEPVTFTACGAPVYRPDAVAQQLWTGKSGQERIGEFPVPGVYATAVDANGGVLINANPLTGLAPDGVIAWTYPNRFLGVHGSQRATAPQPGQLVGPLGFIGQEEIPGVGEVFMLSGNVGEWYLFTTDGLFAARVWQDRRKPDVYSWEFPKAELGMPLDNVTLNGEHFQGSFQRVDNGKYYLVAGHHHASVVELSGLETMKRLETTLTVSRDDAEAVWTWRMRHDLSAVSTALPKILSLTAPPAPVKPDGDLGEWDAVDFTAIGKRGAFAVTADDGNLYVAWRVDSGQPLRNAGDEPNLLFKSGDSVDLQIGVYPDADPKRVQPVPGDQRLLVSLFEGKPIGVLYRHRVPGTPQNDSVGFSSPWRTEYVDRIDRLDPAKIGIARAPKGYAVEAVVPFEFLGLKPQAGKSYKIDIGILSADNGGQNTVERTYWANPNTGLVSDVPGEIMLAPGLWGTVLVSDSNQSARNPAP